MLFCGVAIEFMLIETFRPPAAKAVYRRLRDKGRALPEGVVFFQQLWECRPRPLLPAHARWRGYGLQRGVAEWSGLAHFKIVPVLAGSETAAALAGAL